jgi:hypothetical protein
MATLRGALPPLRLIGLISDLVQHVRVSDCFTSLNDKTKKALLRFSNNCLTKCTALLHVKHDKAGKRISGYSTTAQENPRLQLRGPRGNVCRGLGEFAEWVCAPLSSRDA